MSKTAISTVAVFASEEALLSHIKVEVILRAFSRSVPASGGRKEPLILMGHKALAS